MGEDIVAGRKDASLATAEDWGFAALSAYVLLLAFIQVGTIATALAGWTMFASLARTILAAAAFVGCLAWWRLRLRAGQQDVGNGPPARYPTVVKVVIVAAAATYVALWALACTCPDMSCDGNTYHIPGIHLWAMKGNVCWVDPGFQEAKFMNGYPKGIELMSFVLVQAFGTHLVTAANLTFLPLGVIGIACLAAWLGASRPMTMFAGAAFVLIPVNISQAATTYTDSAFGSCAIAFIASLMFVAKRSTAILPVSECSMGILPMSEASELHRQENSKTQPGAAPQQQDMGRMPMLQQDMPAQTWPQGPWAWHPANAAGPGHGCKRRSHATLVTLGASAGLVVAGKGSGGLMVVVGLTVLAALIVGRAVKARQGRGRVLACGTAFILAAVLIAVVVAGYWHIRNYVMTGNPLYPVKVAVAGHVIFPGDELSKMIGFEETAPAVFRHWPGILKVPYTWAQIGDSNSRWPDTMWFLDSRLGGLGYLWLLGCVPAIIVMLWQAVFRPAQVRRRFLLILLAIVGLIFVVWPMNWWARYTLWIYALGLPCFATVATWCSMGILPMSEASQQQQQQDMGKTHTGELPMLRTARFLVKAGIVMLLLEGVLALVVNIAWAKNPSMYSSVYLLPALVKGPWHRPVCYMMPELNGTVFDEILTGSDGVAVSRLDGQRASGMYNVEILGQLSQPIGRPALLPLPGRVDDAAVAALRGQKVRYVIWEDVRPVPEALTRNANQIHRLPGFVVLVLR